jgi:hypothetical protein
MGAWHMLHGCRLRRKIDQECDVARATQAPTSPDGGEFQKARICISPNNQGSTRRRVLVVLANNPLRVSATDSEEARRIQGNTNRAHWRAEEQRQAAPLCARDMHLEFEEAGLPTFNNPQANLGAALACLQQANPSPDVEAAMAHVRVATALVEEKSAASKSVASTSSQHSHSRSNRTTHSRLPTIQEEVNQPGARAAPAADLRANLDKNRRGRDAHGYIDQRHREREERELQHRLDYDREYGPPGGVHRIMEREERERHDVENRQRTQYEKDYGHHEGPVRNPARQPRSEVVAAVQDDDAAQVGNCGDDMALVAFPALAPRLRSVAYPDNFKPNIQKYDGRSDPNIWLSTYYITIKVAGGNFDHMVPYFPLVMGDAPSLCLNNLPTGSITLWADLSQAFTSNFQATYNRPGNAFNLGRVTMKPGERLRDYTNRFFENRNTCVGVRDDQVVDSYKKGVTTQEFRCVNFAKI